MRVDGRPGRQRRSAFLIRAIAPFGIAIVPLTVQRSHLIFSGTSLDDEASVVRRDGLILSTNPVGKP